MSSWDNKIILTKPTVSTFYSQVIRILCAPDTSNEWSVFLFVLGGARFLVMHFWFIIPTKMYRAALFCYLFYRHLDWSPQVWNYSCLRKTYFAILNTLFPWKTHDEQWALDNLEPGLGATQRPLDTRGTEAEIFKQSWIRTELNSPLICHRLHS